MSLEQDRRDKLDDLIAKGHNPFSPKIVGDENLNLTDINQVRTAFKATDTKETGPQFTIAGRVALKRGHGKLSFMTITSEDGEIQVAIDQSKFIPGHLTERWDWPEFQATDLGDIVVVKGRLAATQRGEITIWADRFKLAAKALTSPPDKVHGLLDPEIRYRQRHVDMWTNPDVMKVLHQRSQIISEIRRFMSNEGFSEVETPMMQPSPGGAIAQPFVTHHNSLDTDLYLRIAPELYLKKLLIGGMKKIFEIGRNFRNEGLSPRHNPEFTSMEAYEAFGNRETMMSLVEELIAQVVFAIHGKLEIPYKEHILDFHRPFKRVTLQELVVGDWGDRTPSYRLNIYEEHHEPNIIQPTFVMNMPAFAMPLARPFGQYEQNYGYAETFELVIGGMEIAPGYTELNDPDIQLKNLQAQASNANVLDQEFVDALKTGMPPAGGLGLGIDRLVAIVTNQPNIRDVIPFPTLRPK